MKVSITIKPEEIKTRNYIAKELRENLLYRQRIVKSKKVYNRKKLKPIKNQGDE